MPAVPLASFLQLDLPQALPLSLTITDALDPARCLTLLQLQAHGFLRSG